MLTKISIIITLLISINVHSNIDTKSVSNFNDSKIKDELLAKFKVEGLEKEKLFSLQKDVLDKSGKSVGALIEVMKKDDYPDKNRWVATFLLGKVMGKQASPFLAKFLSHPQWFMRMASIKTLLALKEKKYYSQYASLLKDPTFIVRLQALDTIKQLNLKKLAPDVWQMLFDKKNYYMSKKSSKAKRTNIIKKVITTIGDLEFEKARDALFTMIQKNKYNDIFEEMEYSLSKITKKKIPSGNRSMKRRFWKKTALHYTNL